LLVVALSDFADHDHFSAFLYAAREYQRKGGFRFLLPLFNQDKDTLTWRDSLKKIVEQEKLSLTSFVEPSADYHSLIDSADFCIHVYKKREQTFEFPLHVAEALCDGKPVVCFNTAPLNEFMAGFKKEWIAHTNEDYSRISRDIAKQALQLEQISTELARHARKTLSVESVSAQYRELYNSLLHK
jgi:glycosyltransferase involved in cell wall biosynthesis